MLFKEKIQRFFLWYGKYKHYTLVFFMKQGQWHQTVVFARHAFHMKLLIYLPTLSLKAISLQVSKQNQIYCHVANVQICRNVPQAPLSHSFQPTGWCWSQHCRRRHTSMSVSTAAVTRAPRPPLTPNSGTLWTQEPGWAPPGRALESVVPWGEAILVQPGPSIGARGWAATEGQQAAASAGSPASRSLICKLPSTGTSSGRSSSNTTF